MMNHSFLIPLSIYKNAVARKKTKITLNYSRHYLIFVRFLVENSLISGYSTQSRRKNKVITIFIKYDFKNNPALLDYSLTSKTAIPKPIKKNSCALKHSNFILNLNSRGGRYSRLLAKIR